MIGKLKKGSSFGGCIRYVTGKDEAKIIASDGVLLGTNAEMTQSFELSYLWLHALYNKYLSSISILNGCKGTKKLRVRFGFLL